MILPKDSLPLEKSYPYHSGRILNNEKSLVLIAKRFRDNLLIDALRYPEFSSAGFLYGHRFYDRQKDVSWIELSHNMPLPRNFAINDLNKQSSAYLYREMENIINFREDDAINSLNFTQAGWWLGNSGTGSSFSDLASRKQQFFLSEEWQVSMMIDPVSAEIKVYQGRQKVLIPLLALSPEVYGKIPDTSLAPFNSFNGSHMLTGIRR